MKMGVAYVMQSPNNFGTPNVFGELTVYENLLAASIGLPRDEVSRRIEEVYSLFPKLRELRDRKAKFLSGGERQMLAISLGLMAAPYTTDIAENSDSTFTKLAFNSPFSTNSANFSTMVV